MQRFLAAETQAAGDQPVKDLKPHSHQRPAPPVLLNPLIYSQKPMNNGLYEFSIYFNATQATIRTLGPGK